MFPVTSSCWMKRNAWGLFDVVVGVDFCVLFCVVLSLQVWRTGWMFMDPEELTLHQYSPPDFYPSVWNEKCCIYLFRLLLRASRHYAKKSLNLSQLSGKLKPVKTIKTSIFGISFVLTRAAHPTPEYVKNVKLHLRNKMPWWVSKPQTPNPWPRDLSH